MNIFDRSDFKEVLNILTSHQDINDLKNNIYKISDNEYNIGGDDIWGNVFTYNELHKLEINNFSYKNNNLIYTIP
jgi:hypothetical protein